MKKSIMLLSIAAIALFGAFYTPEVYLTPIGGICNYYTNKTGAPTIKGQVVSLSTAFPNSVMLCTNGMADGVIYTTGIADGNICPVVVGGIAEVLLESNTYTTNGYWVYATTNGRGNGSLLTPDGGWDAYSTNRFSGLGVSAIITNALNSGTALVKIFLKLNR